MSCGGGACITCSDAATPVRVSSVRPDGLADCGGEEVDVTLVAPVAAGDVVLVHAGVAIARLGRQAA